MSETAVLITLNVLLALVALSLIAYVAAGVPGHHIFGRGRDSTERTHLVHVVDFSGEERCCNLALRDALRRDESFRAKYVEGKERAAESSPEGRVRYISQG